MKRIAINLNQVRFKNLAGEPLNIDKAELGKLLGNYLYGTQSDLGWLDIAQGLYRGETVETDESKAAQLIAIINDPECGVILPVKVAIGEYLNEKIAPAIPEEPKKSKKNS